MNEVAKIGSKSTLRFATFIHTFPLWKNKPFDLIRDVCSYGENTVANPRFSHIS